MEQLDASAHQRVHGPRADPRIAAGEPCAVLVRRVRRTRLGVAPRSRRTGRRGRGPPQHGQLAPCRRRRGRERALPRLCRRRVRDARQHPRRVARRPLRPAPADLSERGRLRARDARRRGNRRGRSDGVARAVRRRCPGPGARRARDRLRAIGRDDGVGAGGAPWLRGAEPPQLGELDAVLAADVEVADHRRLGFGSSTGSAGLVERRSRW